MGLLPVDDADMPAPIALALSSLGIVAMAIALFFLSR